MFLPNPNPAKQLVVFPSQSQIFRLPPTIFLFSFEFSHIIFFFPYPNPTKQTIVFPSQILNLRLRPNLPLFKNISSQSHSQDSSLILSLTLSQRKTFLPRSHEIPNTRDGQSPFHLHSPPWLCHYVFLSLVTLTPTLF